MKMESSELFKESQISMEIMFQVSSLINLHTDRVNWIITQTRFPLIHSPFVKLTQLAKFDKPNEA